MYSYFIINKIINISKNSYLIGFDSYLLRRLDTCRVETDFYFILKTTRRNQCILSHFPNILQEILLLLYTSHIYPIYYVNNNVFEITFM